MRLLGLLLVFGLGVVSAEKLVCYFSSWAVWRPGNGKFDVDDIPPELCTHLVFGFAGLSNYTWSVEVLDPWNELCPDEEGGSRCAYNRFVALKKQNPKLLTILGVGGWREGSEDYSVMADDPAKRKTFIDSTIFLINKHGFDGLDLDWEYPAARGGIPEDKENFVTLLSELREAFHKFNPPLLLSAALAQGKPTMDAAYDIPAIASLLDQAHIMTYDYHGAWDNFTHHNAPLCGYYLDWGINIYFNVVYTINYFLEHGMPKEKLVMGVPTYGRCFTLDSIHDHGMLAPASNPGPPGPYIRLPGTLGFNEICERMLSMDCSIVHDPALHEPYFYCPEDKIWCGFDDEDSVYEKARYAKNMGLGGVLVWTLDTDDFHPLCYDEPFHLIQNMKRALSTPADGKIVECAAVTPTGDIATTTEMSTVFTTQESTSTTTQKPITTTQNPITTTQEPITTTQEPITTTQEPITTTQKPTTTTQEPITTTQNPTTTTQEPITTTQNPTTSLRPISSTTEGPGPHPRPDCSKHIDGSVFPHEDCNKYWLCINGQAVLELCGPGTLFDEDLMICNWKENVDTSHCKLWLCEVDNVYYPAVDCDKYYRCYQGSPHLEQCANGLYWNQALSMCDIPARVDTSQCNIP
ncbi:chitinase-3-like protein 1 [Homarus americanus]|nr:chitinase-3-like protein 1 [Homarus americanus]